MYFDGWIIKGEICEDYYYWINEFEVFYFVYGWVWGNFEEIVYVDLELGYKVFYDVYKFMYWDYYDI